MQSSKKEKYLTEVRDLETLQNVWRNISETWRSKL